MLTVPVGVALATVSGGLATVTTWPPTGDVAAGGAKLPWVTGEALL